MELEWLLAGPILRRTEPGQVCVWLATSEEAGIRGEVVRFDGDRPSEPVGGGEADSVQVGERLFVHLVRMRPNEDGTGFLGSAEVWPHP